jgi:hypothetical protein
LLRRLQWILRAVLRSTVLLTWWELRTSMVRQQVGILPGLHENM